MSRRQRRRARRLQRLLGKVLYHHIMTYPAETLDAIEGLAKKQNGKYRVIDLFPLGGIVVNKSVTKAYRRWRKRGEVAWRYHRLRNVRTAPPVIHMAPDAAGKGAV
jgi:hypothetical protein